MTGLHIAENFGLELIVRSLLTNEGINVDTKDDEYGQTPLWRNEMYGYEAVVKLLLEEGADVESKSNKGQTLLCRAARNRHETVVKLLLEKEIDVESKDTIYDRMPLW